MSIWHHDGGGVSDEGEGRSWGRLFLGGHHDGGGDEDGGGGEIHGYNNDDDDGVARRVVCDNGDDGDVPRSQMVKYMHMMLVLSILIITIS